MVILSKLDKSLALRGIYSCIIFNHATYQAQRITRQQSIKAIQQQYPRLYEMLSELPQFLNDNPEILNTLSQDTGLTKKQILKFMDINSSEGQIIKLGQMSKLGRSAYPVSYIQEDLVKTLEGLQSRTYIQGTSFLVAVTFLHEFVHWGRAIIYCLLTLQKDQSTQIMEHNGNTRLLEQ